MAALGLTAVDGMAQVWFAAADGRLCGGAAAVNGAMRYCWWLRPFTWLYPLPGIRQIEERVYRWVADNRYMLPGGTAVCAINSPKDQRLPDDV
jgi:predicted DCC family thiol-disulfide oxidoreductase YuxK